MRLEDYSDSKNKRSFERDLIAGGVGLSLGSNIISRIPISQAQEGVQEGLSAAGGFFAPMVNLHMGGRVVKSLRELKGNKIRESKLGGIF